MGFLSDPEWTAYERRIDDAWKRGDRDGRERLYASPPMRPTAWNRATSFEQCLMLAPFLLGGLVGTVVGLTEAPSRPAAAPIAEAVGTAGSGFPACGTWLDPGRCGRDPADSSAGR